MLKPKSRLSIILLAALCTLAASLAVYYLHVPNPVIILVVLMIFFEAIGGWIPGAVSGLIIIVYALFYFSTYHRLQYFTATASYKCMVVALSILAMYVLVGRLRQYVDRTYAHVVHLNQALRETNAELETASYHDVLTGLYNRRGGRKLLESWMGGKDTRSLILAVLDVDDFKHFNDAYGHVAGDMVLKHLSREMQHTFPAGSAFIRYGGDEFIIVLKNQDGKEMETLLQDFASREFSFPCQGMQPAYHISCGYALYPEQARSIEALHAHADMALYFVKQSGKRTAALYHEAMDEDAHIEFRFSRADIFQGLPVAVIVYLADESEKIQMATQSAVELIGCHTVQEFMAYTGGRFRNLVHPDDVDRVEEDIRKQIAANSQQLDSVEYRIITKDHKVKRIHDLGRLVDHPVLGKIFYVVLYDKDALSV